MFDKKKDIGTAILMGHMGPEGAKDDYEDDGPDALDTIAQELIDAVHGKSVEGVKACLDAFLAHCQTSSMHQEDLAG